MRTSSDSRSEPIFQVERLRFEPRMQQAVLWSIGAAAAMLYIMLGEAHRIPCFLILALLYPLMPQVWPRSQPNFTELLSPHNCAMLSFFIAMIIEPLNVAIFDAKPATAYALGTSDDYLNITLLLIGLAYVAYCWGYQRAAARRQARGRARIKLHGAPLRIPHLLIGVIFIALGFTSIVLLYGGIGGYMRYLSMPSERLFNDAQLNSSWTGFIGGVLRPFLPFGVVVLWCGLIDQNRRYVPPFVIGAISLVVIPLVVVAAGSFNRGSMIMPLLGMLAVYSARVKRLTAPVLTAIGPLVLLLGMYVGTYRSSSLQMQDVRSSETQSQIRERTDIGSHFAYVFGTSTALERYGLTNMPRLGTTLVSSILQPVPVLGKPFRPSSGMVLYNELIYGTLDINDQVIPCYFELFVDFSLLGIVGGYALIGMLVCHVEAVYKNSISHSGVLTYSMFTIGLWVAGLISGSVAVVSQIFLYSMVPCYIIVWLTRKDRRRALNRGTSRATPTSQRRRTVFVAGVTGRL